MNIKGPKRIISAFMAVIMVMMTLPASTLVNAAAPESVAEWVFAKDPDTTKTLTSFPATGGRAAAPTVTLSTYMGENLMGGTVASYNGTQQSFSVTGWEKGANHKYWQIALPTAGYEKLSVSFNTYGSDTGPRDFKLQYSTDNTTFTDIENGAYTSSSAYSATPAVADLPLPAAVDNKKAVYLRFLQTSDLSLRAGTDNHSATDPVQADGASSLYNIYIKGEQRPDPGTSLVMKKIGSYSTGFSSEDGGVAEIIKYNSDNQEFYLVNGKEKKVDIVSLKSLKSEQDNVLTLDKRIDVSTMIDGFTFGDITSVDINTQRDIIAIAVQEADYSKAGAVLLLDYDGNYLAHYTTGVQPDMVTFTPDSNYLLTADEGEPREGYVEPAIDPKGTVTVVNLQTQTAKTVGFANFDSVEARNKLLADNVILKKQTAPSVDLEPEYAAISADSKQAYIALQEANAIATLDIESGVFTSVKGLGFKDHSIAGNELDMRRDGKIQIQTEANVLGMYNPDGIASYTAGGKTYILTANEGDSRDWNKHNNEKDVKLGKGQDGDSTKDIKVTTFDTSEYEVGAGGTGFAGDKMYLFGARSFAIWDAADMSLVYDSGAGFEQNTARLLPDYFNWSNDDYVFEKRSAKKGPEPEDIKVGVVDGKPYAFIGLERVGGNMMYDISDVSAPAFYEYQNTRDFANSIDHSGSKPAYQIAGDVSPEGQHFIPADVSPTRYPLLLVANEVSGTVSVIEIPKGRYTPPVVPITTPTPTPAATPTPTATPAPTSGSGAVPVATATPTVKPSAQPAAGTQTITVNDTVAAAVLALNAETGEASFKLTDEAAAKLLANASANGTAGKRTVVEIRGEEAGVAKKVTVELSRDFLSKLSSGTEADLRINTGLAVLTLGNQAVDAISKAAEGELLRISVDRSSTTTLNSSVQALVGGRPVYDFSITGGASGITSFGGENISVQIPYSQAAGEKPNAIAVYYIDNNGNASSVTSRYNAAVKAVEFQTGHFSKFAVSSLDAGFSDTVSHWAKDSIDFAAARGWFTGLGNQKFAPDQTLTRGMIATVLGKMSGADISQASAFTDVQAQKYYAPYIAWAAANGIVQGTGNNRFAPEQAVSREELAVLMNNYLNYLKLKPEQAATPSSFADSQEISAWAAAAVTSVQQSGLISGKPGNRFDPQGTATRAEVTAVLKKLNDSRFAE